MNGYSFVSIDLDPICQDKKLFISFYHKKLYIQYFQIVKLIIFIINSFDTLC